MRKDRTHTPVRIRLALFIFSLPEDLAALRCITTVHGIMDIHATRQAKTTKAPRSAPPAPRAKR
jgi:hypothetical protein